jgi:hypothetical protein
MSPDVEEDGRQRYCVRRAGLLLLALKMKKRGNEPECDCLWKREKALFYENENKNLGLQGTKL